MQLRRGLYFLIVLLFGCTSKTNKNISAYPTALSSKEKDQLLVELGKALFFDQRLSLNNTISCSSCHLPELAFSDASKTSIGIHQRQGKRNSPSLWNVRNQDQFMWDGGVKTLEMQAIVPLQDTNEMGGTIMDLFPKLSKIKLYDSLAHSIYQRDFDPFVLTRALSAYQKSIYQENSAFDDWKNKGIVKDSALVRGFKLFDEELNCTACHSGSSFTNNSLQNNGIYAKYEDPGRYNITADSNDIGKFKVPTLRNIAITKPYMHDGEMANLETVIEHYKTGGKQHFNQSQHIQPFTLTNQEQTDLIYFLNALTDKQFLD